MLSYCTLFIEARHSSAPRFSGRPGHVILTLPDFLFWGVIKERVYATKPPSLQELKNRITAELHALEPELCAKVCRAVRHRQLWSVWRAEVARLCDCIEECRSKILSKWLNFVCAK